MRSGYHFKQSNRGYPFGYAMLPFLALVLLAGIAIQESGAPKISNTSPSDGAENVALDADITVTFDRSVIEEDLSQVEIRDAEDNPVEGVSADLDDNALYIDHDDFEYSKNYTVFIPARTVRNNQGGGANGSYRWSFTTIREAPLAVNESPPNGSENVALDAEISVEFDQDVIEEDLDDVEIRDADDNEVEEVRAELSDNMLTIAHADFNPHTEYTVTIPEGTVENEHEYENEEYSWSFTTVRIDVLAENESPPDGAEGVALDAEITVEFNQPVNEGDLGRVEIREAEDNAVEGVSADLDDNALIIDHDDFDYFTVYTVVIPEGTVVDNGGVGNEAFSWSFTTLRGAPLAVNESPPNGSGSVALDAEISVEFDQDVIEEDLDDVEILDADENEVEDVGAELSGNKLTIAHADFNPHTEYTAVIPEGTVENEHEYENEEFSWSFVTIRDAPQAINESPPESAAGVALDVEVSVGFDQQVNAANLEAVEIVDADDNPVAGISVELAENELTIADVVLGYFTEYTVFIPEGAVGNEGEIGNEAFSWSFTTVRDAPQVINERPEDGAENVATDAEIRAGFDENVSAANLEGVEIVDANDNPVAGVSAELAENELAIAHAEFGYFTEYTVIIPEGTVENEGEIGNEAFSWSFSTETVNPTTVRLVSPQDGAVDVILQPELVWEQVEFADTYHLQLTSGTDFEDELLIDESGLEETTFSVGTKLEEGRIYRWRVRAGNPAGDGSWSEVRTFTTEYSTITLEQVVLREPIDSAGSIAREAELSWEPVDDADSYHIEIDTTPEFDEPVTVAEVQEAGWLSSELRYYTIYYWRVRGENSDGPGPWSEPGVFITEAEVPELQFPLDEAGQISIAPQLSWSSNHESTRFEVRLNTEASFAQEYQSFDTETATLSVNGLTGNTNYYWQVRLADEFTTSEWSMSRRFTTREDPVEETVQVYIDFESNSEESVASEDFRLIGFPGGTAIALDDIFRGEYNEEWRAFRDTGADEDYLQEFDPEDPSFSFGSGQGYWVFNREPVETDTEITPVELDEGDTYPISLQPGWNIISNPFNQSLQWSDVTDFNDIDASLFGYDRVFQAVESMESLKGYYLYNDPEWDLDFMHIPYAALDKRRPREEESASGQQGELMTQGGHENASIRLLAEFYDSDAAGKGVQTGVTLLYNQGVGEELHPSLKMAQYGAVLENREDESQLYQRITTTYEPDGREYGLRIKAPVGGKVAWNAEFYNIDGSSMVLLVNPVTQQAHMLADDREAEIRITEPEVRYQLYVGDESYLKDIREHMLPGEVTLKPNYPNPFNPTTTIRYALVEETRVSLEVYNMLGQRVATLVEEAQEAGWQTAQFDGSRLASGTYLYRLVTGEQVKTGKMMLVK